MSALQTVLTAVGGWIGLNVICVLLVLAVGAWRRRVEARREAAAARVQAACEPVVAEVDEQLRRQPLPPSPALDGTRPSPSPGPAEPEPACPGLPVDADGFTVRVEFDAIADGLGDVRTAASRIEESHRTGEDSR